MISDPKPLSYVLSLEVSIEKVFFFSTAGLDQPKSYSAELLSGRCRHG